MKSIIISGIFIFVTLTTGAAMAREVLDTPEAKRQAAALSEELRLEAQSLQIFNSELTSVQNKIDQIQTASPLSKSIEINLVENPYSRRLTVFLVSRGAELSVLNAQPTLRINRDKLPMILAIIANEQDSLAIQIHNISVVRFSLRP